MKKTVLSPMALLLALSLLPSAGCASKYPTPTTRVHYYPQCYRPLSDVYAAEQQTTRATGAGAAGGALLGALIGGLSTGKVEGALAGAVAGGAAGAVGGHMYAKSQEKAATEQYRRMLGDDSETMNRTTAASRVAMRCYEQQFTYAKQAYKAGKYSPMEFQARYEEIRSGLQDTANLLRSTSGMMDQKAAEYQQQLQEEYTNAVARPVQTAATQPREKTTPKAIPAKSKTKPKRTPPPAEPQSEVTSAAADFKTAKQELEQAQHDIDARISSYEQSVGDLLG